MCEFDSDSSMQGLTFDICQTCWCKLGTWALQLTSLTDAKRVRSWLVTLSCQDRWCVLLSCWAYHFMYSLSRLNLFIRFITCHIHPSFVVQLNHWHFVLSWLPFHVPSHWWGCYIYIDIYYDKATAGVPLPGTGDTWLSRLQEAIGPSGYDSSHRRSVQTVVLYEAVSEIQLLGVY